MGPRQANGLSCPLCFNSTKPQGEHGHRGCKVARASTTILGLRIGPDCPTEIAHPPMWHLNSAVTVTLRPEPVSPRVPQHTGTDAEAEADAADTTEVTLLTGKPTESDTALVCLYPYAHTYARTPTCQSRVATSSQPLFLSRGQACQRVWLSSWPGT